MFWRKPKKSTYHANELIDQNGHYYNLAAAVKVWPVVQDSDSFWVVRIDFSGGYALLRRFSSGSAAHRFRDRVIAKWRADNK